MILSKSLPTFIESALVIIFKSHEEIEIGLQFLSSCLFLPAFGIREIMLSVCDSGRVPMRLEYSHASMIIGRSKVLYVL